jgi:predicted transcriptional regulator
VPVDSYGCIWNPCLMKDPRPLGITFRPPPELRERLKRFADAHRWSMNIAIEQLVTEALDARDRESATP